MAIEPRTFAGNDDWYAVTREFETASPVEDEATITPGQIAACHAPMEWVVAYEVSERPLETGAHVALEVPIHFRLDHGRPYPAGRGHVAHADDAAPGYEVAVDVRPESDDVEVAYEVSNTSRLSVVDVAIVDGAVNVGDTVALILGPERASRLRAPTFAQEFPFACGVDRDGDGSYRPVESFPSVIVTGAAPHRFRLLAPSTVDADEVFDFDLYPADRYNHNPVRDYDREVRLDGNTDAVDPPDSVTLGSESGDWTAATGGSVPGDVYHVHGTAASNEGIGRVTAYDPELGISGRSNPVGVDWSDRNIYWGDIHVQGYDSIGVGSTDEMYEWGRDVEGLDFCSTANHFGGRYPVTPERWAELVETTNRYNEPGTFTTFVSYEAGMREGGDLNVYYRDETGDFYSAKENESSIVRRDGTWVAVDERCHAAGDLWANLDAFDGSVLTVPHHPRTAAFGLTDWDDFHDDYQRLVEIYSAWGDSEVGGEHSVRTALDRGHRVGFVAGTDSHNGQPGTGPHEFNLGSGLTAVYADELTRDGIFDALHERRAYATTGARILLDVAVNGLAMGRERVATAVDEYSRTIRVRAVGTRDIVGVDIVRNSDVIATHDPDGDRATFEWKEDAPLRDHLRSREHPDGKRSAYYYVRVRQSDRHTAWSSPIWFLES